MIRGRRDLGGKVTNIALCAGAVFMFIFGYVNQVEAQGNNSCIACHSNPDFAAFNKKLRMYFLKWENSNHADSGITCDDCHGGNPGDSDKKKAHAGKQKSIYFTDIPKTCGNCHGAIYDGFIKSDHYKYLEKPDVLNMHGANCVTCHSPGSPLIGMGANPEAVEKSCALCHNYRTKNSPEVPAKAMAILVKFNAVKQQFNRLIMRTEVMPSQEFVNASQGKIWELAAAWHSFDLKRAGEKTDEVLALLKNERKKLRKIKTKRIYEKGKTDPLYGN